MRKRLTLLTLALVLCLTGAFFAAGCSKEVYTVTYYAENGIDVLATKQVEEGLTTTSEIEGVEERAGYTIVWNDANGNAYDFTAAVNGNLTLFLTYAPMSGIAYKVEHYVESVTGKYEVADTENLTGTTAETVTATPKTYEGCAFDGTNKSNVTTATVKGDGSTVLKQYYKRNEYEVTFKNGNKKVDGKDVKHGGVVEKTKKVVPDQNKTTTTVETFSHWSATENGEAFDFNTVITADTTLYAVFKTVSREYEVTVDTTGADGFWTVVPVSESTTVTAGQAYQFTITLGDEASAVTEVTATIGNDIEDTEKTVAVTATDGVYSVTVTGETVISVKVAKATYEVSASYTNPSASVYANEGVQWANPYQSDAELIVLATNTVTEETLEFKNACNGGKASFAIPAGEWSIALAKAEGENNVVISNAVSYTINKSLNNAGSSDSESESESAPAGNVIADALVIGEKIAGSDLNVAEDGKITSTKNSSYYVRMENFNPGTNDFAITVTYDQIMELFTPTTALETAPTLGIKFYNENNDRAGLHVFGEGGGRVVINDNWAAENKHDNIKMLCTAGAIFGKLEWPDCYRYAQLTYVKKGDIIYVIISANGDAGGIRTDGTVIGSSAVTYEDYLLYAVDITTGTVYFNIKKDTQEYNTWQHDGLKTALNNITSAEFRNMCGGANNSNQNRVRAYAYGYTYDAEVINGYASKFENVLSVTVPTGATVSVDGEAYAQPVVYANGHTPTITVELPEGKIIDSIKNGEDDIVFTIEGKSITFIVPAGFTAKNHNVVITLKDGQYVEQTQVTGTITAKDGITFDKTRTSVKFIAADGDELIATYNQADSTYSVTLPAGLWNAIVLSDAYKSTPVTVMSGEGATATANLVINSYNELRYVNSAADGMSFNADTGALHWNPNNGATQETSIKDASFTPANQLLEFSFTLTGMLANQNYPFIGMFIKDSAGGMIRVVWSAAGDEMTLMTRSDYPGRLKIMDTDNWDFFGSKCGMKDADGNNIAPYYYNWDQGKTWVQEGKYRMDAKFVWDGYVFKLYARTSETLKVSDQWVEISAGFDVYNRYNTATAGWQNQDYRNAQSFKTDIFKTDLACTFGVSARIDKGTISRPVFSNIEWKVTDKSASDAEHA